LVSSGSKVRFVCMNARTTRGGGLLFFVVLSASAAGCASGSQNARAATTPEAAAEMCVGVPEPERSRPEFLQSGEIEAVRPFMGERHYIKFSEPELRGAELFVRSSPGMTKEWIARVVRCHVAWLESRGLTAMHGFEDPLVVGDPAVSFSGTETGFVVRIAGRNKAEGEEILRRAQRLVQAPQAAAVRD
jgi:hypothetical protein